MIMHHMREGRSPVSVPGARQAARAQRSSPGKVPLSEQDPDVVMRSKLQLRPSALFLDGAPQARLEDVSSCVI